MPSRLAVTSAALGVLDQALFKARPSILTETGFIRELLREANRLQKVVRGSIEQVMSRVRRSTNINWPDSTASQRNNVIRQLQNLLQGLPSEFAPGITVVLDEHGRRVVVDTRRGHTKKYKTLKVEPRFTQVDREGVQALRDTTSIFFSHEYERQARNFRPRAQKVIADGLERGFDRREIARDLQNEFRTVAAHESYWQTVAAVHTNRARSFSSAVTFLDAGVDKYEIAAVDDERTTPICRMLDGKVFEVGRALDQFQAFEDAEDLDEVKTRVMPFLRVRGDGIVLPSGSRVATITGRGFTDVASNRRLNAVGIHMPPYHFACRTTVIPVL